jgi:putative hydrolase of the HAD superfamily
MSHAPTVLILDFGGVLTTDLWSSIRAGSRRAGLPENAVLELMRDDSDGRERFTALERGDIAQTEYEAFLADRLGVTAEGFLAGLCADLRPDDAMCAAVRALHRNGVRTAVLSNSWGAGSFDPYRGWDFTGLADAVVVSHEVGMRKPEPDIFAHTLRVLDAPARDAVFVDDIRANLVPAAALGIRTVHHTRTPDTLATFDTIFSGK